jgi:hypothetical protein
VTHIDAALLRASELTDVPPARARAIAEHVLRAVVDRGIDAETALGLVRRR